jgi:hypothetical protein
MSRIISPRNLYSKISEFLFLFNHMHEFLPFYLFIFFPGFTGTRPEKEEITGEVKNRKDGGIDTTLLGSFGGEK